jgi:2C-methyl-D-erythritol 2,4-cyclodiphosphate synthase
MIANIAADLGLPEKDINVKAKTNEQLDAVGRKEAIVAQAIVLLGELADEEDHDHDDH